MNIGYCARPCLVIFFSASNQLNVFSNWISTMCLRQNKHPSYSKYCSVLLWSLAAALSLHSVSQVESFQIGSAPFGSSIRQKQRQNSHLLAAPKEAPQYQKNEAVLQRVEPTGKGNFLLHVEYISSINDKGDASSAIALDYHPGNVLALEIEQPSTTADDVDSSSVGIPSAFSTINEKTQKDLKMNDGWLRGPYTITRSSPSGFQILIKEVGYKSHIFATSKPGTAVRFGGKFKVPIVEGILNALDFSEVCSPTERVVMVSSGVGVGPCIGALEIMLNSVSATNDYPPFLGRIDLLASFRSADQVAMAKDLDTLAAGHPDRFYWTPIITSEVGRLSITQETLCNYLKLNDGDKICAVQKTHYHVIGNGQLVNEWKAGLEKAGVPSERVTVESYFNTMVEANATAVENIAAAVQAALVGSDNLASVQNQTVQC
jgi:hypothetical protein